MHQDSGKSDVLKRFTSIGANHPIKVSSNSDIQSEIETQLDPLSNLPSAILCLTERVLDLPLPDEGTLVTMEYWLGDNSEKKAILNVIEALELVAGKLTHHAEGLQKNIQHLTRKRKQKYGESVINALVTLDSTLFKLREEVKGQQEMEERVRMTVDSFASIVETTKKTMKVAKQFSLDMKKVGVEQSKLDEARESRQIAVHELEEIFMKRAENQSKAIYLTQIMNIYRQPDDERDYRTLHRLLNAERFVNIFDQELQQNQLGLVGELYYFTAKLLDIRAHLTQIKYALAGIEARISHIVALSWSYFCSEEIVWHEIARKEAKDYTMENLVPKEDIGNIVANNELVFPNSPTTTQVHALKKRRDVRRTKIVQIMSELSLSDDSNTNINENLAEVIL